MDKASRLVFGDSLMTHAMVLTGCHVEGSSVTRSVTLDICISRLPSFWINIVVLDGGLKIAGVRTEARKVTFSWHPTGSRLVYTMKQTTYVHETIMICIKNNCILGVCVRNCGRQEVGAKGGSWDKWVDFKWKSGRFGRDSSNLTFHS